MILSSEGRSSDVLSMLQDSVSPSGVAPRSLFRFGDGRDCVEHLLEDHIFGFVWALDSYLCAEHYF